MENYRGVVKVFIGSPSDVSEERRRFVNVVAEVNKSLADNMRIQIVPVGWEDALRGKVRPQDRINEDIRDCDLVVLLLWKRWGRPTGKYSSGFEEEFELANSLNDKNGGRPEIVLYLRHIPDELTGSADEQLTKVRDCQKQNRERKQVFL
ncbi:MAG: DUF4062 domain-containing protein [Chloroflexi bacterium]|nr:DUF4062 domain-containing protein [Chloroflexota bacterium]